MFFGRCENCHQQTGALSHVQTVKGTAQLCAFCIEELDAEGFIIHPAQEGK